MAEVDLWTVEGPDYDAGILGLLVVHECAGNPEFADATEVRSETTQDHIRRAGVLRTTYRCEACGAEHTVEDLFPLEFRD